MDLTSVTCDDRKMREEHNREEGNCGVTRETVEAKKKRN
jgi:hypothetical protein